MKLKGGENASTTDIYTSNRIKVGDTLTKKSLALDISGFEFNVGDVDVLGSQSTDYFLTLKTRAKERNNKDTITKANETADTLINTIKRQNKERKQYPLVGRYNKGGLMVNPKSRVN